MREGVEEGAEQFGKKVTTAWPGINPTLAGGPVRELSTEGLLITERGIEVVESHVARFGPDKANDAMLGRLREIASGQTQATAQDLNYYAHELREYTRYRKMGWKSGIPSESSKATELWRQTHTATLGDYGLPWKGSDSDELLFHPDALPYLYEVPK